MKRGFNFEDLYEILPKEVFTLLSRIREAIREVIPRIEEQMNNGMVFYTHGRRIALMVPKKEGILLFLPPFIYSLSQSSDLDYSHLRTHLRPVLEYPRNAEQITSIPWGGSKAKTRAGSISTKGKRLKETGYVADVSEILSSDLGRLGVPIEGSTVSYWQTVSLLLEYEWLRELRDIKGIARFRGSDGNNLLPTIQCGFESFHPTSVKLSARNYPFALMNSLLNLVDRAKAGEKLFFSDWTIFQKCLSKLDMKSLSTIRYHLFQKLNIVGLETLDLPLASILEFLSGGIELARTRIYESLGRQIDNCGTTIFLDIDKISKIGDLVVRLDDILRLRKQELQNLSLYRCEINGPDYIDLTPLWLTAYGFRLLEEQQAGITVTEHEFKKILSLFQNLGYDIQIVDDSEPIQYLPMSEEMRSYIIRKIPPKARRSIFH
ncbi:MAG: hypothetical protein GF411_16545 [Candidatus Lokiarchaeota archaeon]|nr:hypothetical protein [Candidatus Lokiarchaeota archaeon]